MSIERIDELHWIATNLTLKGILQLLKHQKLSFDELLNQLIISSEELRKQLSFLDELIEKPVNSEGNNGKYKLTRKGKETLEMLEFFPEIVSENYEEVINQKYFSAKALTAYSIRHMVTWARLGLLVSILFGVIGSALLFFQFNEPVAAFNFAEYAFSGGCIIGSVVGALIGFLLSKQKRYRHPIFTKLRYY